MSNLPPRLVKASMLVESALMACLPDIANGGVTTVVARPSLSMLKLSAKPYKSFVNTGGVLNTCDSAPATNVVLSALGGLAFAVPNFHIVQPCALMPGSYGQLE